MKDCLDLVALRRCAVKIVSKVGVRKIPGGWSQALTEACLLRALAPHRHIVAVSTILRLNDPDRVVLVMEHCLGSVHDLQAAGVTSATSGATPPVGQERFLAEAGEGFHRIATLPTIDGEECEDEDSPVIHPPPRKQSAFYPAVAPNADDMGFQQFRRLPEAQAHAYFIQVTHPPLSVSCHVNSDIIPSIIASFR